MRDARILILIDPFYFSDLSDVVVYGVAVPGCEGRAGMAAIVDSDKIDMDSLATSLINKLPVYARPHFLRLAPELDMTGTYKLKKRDLQLEGFNPDKIKDKLYFLDAKSNKYITLDSDLHFKISSGQVRF